MSQTESPVQFQSGLRTDPSGQALSNKIKPHHMERLAVVYVRQSSAQQVLNHQESTALQYSLREKALAWGWPSERIVVLDEDQAHSGSTAVGRAGFQRLLVEVGLNHVGLILGIEMSRLARSCKDWYQLLEVCAIFQTILADQDGLYDQGQLQWRRPNRQTLRNLLQHPIYAGAYTWGRRAVDPRRKIPGRPSTGRTVVAPEQCMVFLKDRCPAYITWDRYQAILKQITDNQVRSNRRGPVREGSALLGGLLVCGQCGRRMNIKYFRYQRSHGAETCQVHYCCDRNAIDYGTKRCQILTGRVLETLITKHVLTVLKPASIELSLTAAEDIEQERRKVDCHWRHRLERAQ